MFILRRENNPDRQGKKSTIGGKRSLFLVYKEDVRGSIGQVCFSSFYL